MSLQGLLEPGRVLCNVEARSRKHVLEILSELLASAENDLTAGEIFDSLVSRERLGSTALGGGVALPHGRVPGIDGSIAAFVRLSQGVEFDAPDGVPVTLVLGLLVPEQASEQHLGELSSIAKRLSRPPLRAALAEAGSSSAIFEALTAPAEPAQAGA
jgi:PTS system nitrogen regulatory IIA component